MSPYWGGCCNDVIRIDERYDLELDKTVARIKQLGKKVGFYTGVNDALGMGTSAGASWLRDWWLFNKLGRGAWSAEVSTHLPRFSDGTIPGDAVIEGYVDVFPRAAMLSGALRMAVLECSAAQPAGTCDPACDRQCPFLPLARTIMGNHIGYLGASNGDHVYMGKTAGYHLERQAFLLGLKLDISNPDWSADVVAQIRQLRASRHDYIAAQMAAASSRSTTCSRFPHHRVTRAFRRYRSSRSPPRSAATRYDGTWTARCTSS